MQCAPDFGDEQVVVESGLVQDMDDFYAGAVESGTVLRRDLFGGHHEDWNARRLGIASRLMSHIEDFARGIGRDLLTLDTATESPAMGMYRRLGWEEWGTCKGYASWPDGSRCDATFFRREL